MYYIFVNGEITEPFKTIQMKDSSALLISEKIRDENDFFDILNFELTNLNSIRPFEEMYSSTSGDEDVYLTETIRGSLIYLGNKFVLSEMQLIKLSERGSILKFTYNALENEFTFQLYQNGKCRKRGKTIDKRIITNEGETLEIEYSGLKPLELFEFLYSEISGERYQQVKEKEFGTFKYLHKGIESIPTITESNFSNLSVGDKTSPSNSKRANKTLGIYIIIGVMMLCVFGLTIWLRGNRTSVSTDVSTQNVLIVDDDYCKLYNLPRVNFSCSYSSSFIKSGPVENELNEHYMGFNIEDNGICSEGIALNKLEIRNSLLVTESVMKELLNTVKITFERDYQYIIYEYNIRKVLINGNEYLTLQARGKSLNPHDEFEGEYLIQYVLFTNGGTKKNGLSLMMFANHDSSIKSFDDFSKKGYISEVITSLRFND